MLYASFSTISMITFLSFLQPYLLNEVLQMPRSEQGTFTGILSTMQEVIGITITGYIGAWSDRAGRRLVYVTGLSLMGLGYLVYPTADSATQLVIFRAIYAVGASISPVMMSATVVDYIQERSRGRWLSANTVCTGLGALFMALVLAKTPQMYLDAGADAVNAGRFAFWTAAGICFATAIILRVGLADYRPAVIKRVSMNKLFLSGITEGFKNPRLALAYMAGFVGRGDLIIIASFLSLWVVHAGNEMGMSTGQALARGGILYAILQTASLCWSPVMGWIIDRINRVTALAVGLALASVGYWWMGMVEDPFAASTIPVAIALGIGEISVIIAGGSLMGQEARPQIRGAIVGVFGIVGGFGIMVCNLAGGIVFDRIGPTAPFTLMGFVNAALMILALLVLLKGRHRSPATEQA